MFDPVEKLKEFVRHPSVSTDPKFQDGMRGAQEFVGGLSRSLGFAVEVVPDRPASDHPGAARGRSRLAARHHLRPLRRAAARSAEPVEDAAVRADGAGRPPLGPRRGRQQGPAAGAHRGGRPAPGEESAPAAAHHLSDRGRGGDGQPELSCRSCEKYRRPAERADFVFLSDTGIPARGPGGDHLRPARPDALRGRGHRRPGSTCTPACTAACCAIRSRRWPRCAPRCTRRTAG